MNQDLTGRKSTSDLLELLPSEFEKAEEAIKSYENLVENCPFHAVNELRFAASHLVKSVKLGINDNEECRVQLEQAIKHAQRAYLNASIKYEFLSLSSQTQIYRESIVGYEHLAATIVPHYIEHIGKIDTLEKISWNEYEQEQETPEFIGRCTKHIQVNKAFINDFLSAQKPLFSAIAHDRKGFRLSWYLCVLGIMASFLLGYFFR